MKHLFTLACFSALPLMSLAQIPRPDGKDEANRIVEITSESEALVKLDELIGPEIWQQSSDEVADAYKKKGFAWLSPTVKDRALIRPRQLMLKEETSVEGDSTKYVRYKGLYHKLELFGRPAFEVSMEFAKDKVSVISISIWNKGDARQSLTEPRFKEMITMAAASLDSAIGVRGKDLGKDTTGAVRMSRWRWETPTNLTQLESSSSKNQDRSFQAEFIRVRLMPRPRSLVGNPGASTVDRPRTFDLTKNVKKTEGGDVFISNMPMVDQGEKGYCAVASTERVMRYYGVQVDQHELAEAASTTARRGTNPKEFEDAAAFHPREAQAQGAGFG